LRWVSPPPLALASRSTTTRICQGGLPTSLDDARLVAAFPPQDRPSVKRHTTSTGLSTRCPSAAACAYALGPTNPPRIILAAEPLGFRWWGFAPHFSVTHSGIRTRRRSTAGLRCRFHAPTTLPYPWCCHHAWASVDDFAPLDYRRSGTRPVSCYALFQGWLLLSQPPGCLRTATSFPTQPSFGDLSRRSGLFPF
jgi:hypothetical protein